MVARGSKDGMTDGEVSDPVDALGDMRDKTGEVDPSVDASNTMLARSINGSD